MRDKGSVAVTITLPKALHDAVKELAKRRDCGNVSAVIRQTLYKEVENGTLVLKDERAVREIKAAEQRSVKYSSIGKKGIVEVHPEDAAGIVRKLSKPKK